MLENISNLKYNKAYKLKIKCPQVGFGLTCRQLKYVHKDAFI